MKKFQSISAYILLPTVTITAIFAVVLYFLAGTTVNRIITKNLEINARNKVADIEVSEKRIASKMLALASLFSRAEAIQQAYLKAS